MGGMSFTPYTLAPGKAFAKKVKGAALPLNTGSTRIVKFPTLIRYDEWPNHTITGGPAGSEERSVLMEGTGCPGAVSFGRCRYSFNILKRLVPFRVTSVGV